MLVRELVLKRPMLIVLTKFLGVYVFVAALCFSALVKIPLFFTPVPITLQTMVVCLSGAVLGPRLGLAAVISYLMLGIFGVPLFTQAGSGLVYFFGPTGGYLVGFLLAASLVGVLSQALKSRNLGVCFMIMLAGMLAIYCAGGFWLKVGYGWPLKNIFFFGILPFIVPDMFKALMAAVIYKKL